MERAEDVIKEILPYYIDGNLTQLQKTKISKLLAKYPLEMSWDLAQISNKRRRHTLKEKKEKESSYYRKLKNFLLNYLLENFLQGEKEITPQEKCLLLRKNGHFLFIEKSTDKKGLRLDCLTIIFKKNLAYPVIKEGLHLPKYLIDRNLLEEISKHT